MVRGPVGQAKVESLRVEADRWVAESRGHLSSYGATPNGGPRFDLEPGHGSERPKLRRVVNPADISTVYRDFVWDCAIPDLVTDLIGPDIKFHHCKLNLKLPGMKSDVGYHQDHPFQPHTNDDWVTCLLFLDDMDEENGCLHVLPGSHRQQHSHFQGDVFAGAITDTPQAVLEEAAVPVAGRAGDLCLLDSWCVHGSRQNLSSRPRRLFIFDYVAADSFSLVAYNAPSIHTGAVVRGQATRLARLTPRTLEMPTERGGATIFRVQKEDSTYRG